MGVFTFNNVMAAIQTHGLTESFLLPMILNMSITGSLAILFVLLVRLALKRAPKIFSYALWAVVLFRLLCPVSITTDFSLLGLFDTPTMENTEHTTAMEYVPFDVVHTQDLEVHLPVAPVINEAVNDALPQEHAALGADPLEGEMAIASFLWMLGMGAMAVYSVVAYLRLRGRLLTASPLRENIYLADEITSPFVMGLVRPKIYLPSDMEEREQAYIILHEQHHIRRCDHIIKALAFLALSIHWFNPLVWVAFIYSNKDMEMSCDEAVIKKMGDGVLADYTASLLSLATGKHIIAGMPLAFGEGDTKGRIRNLANWREPAFWVVAVAVVLCIVAAVCLLTNPEENPEGLPTLEQTYLAIASKGEEFDVGLKGKSRQSVVNHWGESDGSWGESDSSLSGVEGDVWNLNGLAAVIVYYDSDGNVERVKVNEIDSINGQTQAVKWTYSPMMSATWHGAFHFGFDLNDSSYVEASCDNGMLWNLYAEGQPRDKALRFEAGEPVCWTPDTDGITAQAAINFTVYVDGEVLCCGTLDIICTGTENSQSFYEAKLSGTHLIAMQQRPNNLGASLVPSDYAFIVAWTDLNHNRVSDCIVVREVETNMLYELSVLENGLEIWSTQVGTAHTGWNTIMLHSTNEGDCLVEYTPSMFQGVGSYTCTVFSLESNQKMVKDEWSVDFELPVKKTPEMERFAQEVGVLLRNCSVLLSTEQGIVVKEPAMATAVPQLYPVRFDPDEIMQAIEVTADPTTPQELTGNAAAFPTEALEFVFASGAGGWGTYLTLQPDGHFIGDYGDSDVDTRYECKFEGQFTNIQQISDYCWTMKLGDVTTEKEEGTTWTDDGIHYIAAGPHGVSGGADFLLYAPGTPADLIPAECRNWWPDAYLWRSGEVEQLEGWGLCNLNEGTAFFTTWKQ